MMYAVLVNNFLINNKRDPNHAEKNT